MRNDASNPEEKEKEKKSARRSPLAHREPEVEFVLTNPPFPFHRHELEHEEKGVDIFAEDYAWIHAPPGTIDKPVVVTSDFTERIVGVTDPEDDNSVIWGVVREGEPPKQIVEDGEYFILKRN